MSVDVKKAYTGAALAKPPQQEPDFYFSTTSLTQPLQARGYYRPSPSLALFAKMLSEMVAVYGLRETYTSCEAREFQDGSIKLKLFLRTDLLGRMTDHYHKIASRVFSDIALEDEHDLLMVNPYEMWAVAPSKIAMMKGLVSVIDQSNNMLLPPDRIRVGSFYDEGLESDWLLPGGDWFDGEDNKDDKLDRIKLQSPYDQEPESEWISAELIGFTEEDHQSVRHTQGLEYLARRANQYRNKYSKGDFKDDLFLGLETRPYVSLAHTYAGMTAGSIANISVSLEHLLKTILQENGSAYLHGNDTTNTPGGYN